MGSGQACGTKLFWPDDSYFGLMIPQAQIRNDTIGSIQSLVHWVVGPRVRFLLGATGPVVRTFSLIFQNLPELNWLG